MIIIVLLIVAIFSFLIFFLYEPSEDSESKERSNGLSLYTPDNLGFDLAHLSKINYLLDFYNPKSSHLRNWYQAIKSRKRVEQLDFMTQELMFTLKQGAEIETAAIQSQQRQLEFKRWIADNYFQLETLRLHKNLLEQAVAAGMGVGGFEQVNVQKAINTDAVRTEQQMSEVRIEEHRRKSEIDLENRWKEIMQDLNAADMEAIATRLVIKKMRKELEEARRERYSVEVGSDPKQLKSEILGDYDNYITNLTKQINATETRLLQEANR